MRKKIIKSYFFKRQLSFNSTKNLFCFSKRAVKCRKHLNALTKFTNKSTALISKNLILYKFYILHFVLYSKAVFIKNSLLTLFTYSVLKNKFVCRNNTFKKYNNVKIWYLTTRKYYTSLKKNLTNYPNTGMLSSHFVHFLLKKNLSYQTRSKYKSNIISMNSNYFYLYLYTQILVKYNTMVQNKLYFFTHNLSKKSSVVDVDFNVNLTNWTVYNSSLNTSYISAINNVDYNNIDIHEIFIKAGELNVYFNEVDLSKKDLLKAKLDLSKTDLLAIAQTAQRVYFTAPVNVSLLDDIYTLHCIYNLI